MACLIAGNGDLHPFSTPNYALECQGLQFRWKQRWIDRSQAVVSHSEPSKSVDEILQIPRGNTKNMGCVIERCFTAYIERGLQEASHAHLQPFSGAVFIAEFRR